VCNVCSFVERLVLLAGADHRVPHRRRPTAALERTLKALNPQPNPRESGPSCLGFVSLLLLLVSRERPALLVVQYETRECKRCTAVAS
jgi:hypothetical protein